MRSESITIYGGCDVEPATKAVAVSTTSDRQSAIAAE